MSSAVISRPRPVTAICPLVLKLSIFAPERASETSLISIPDISSAASIAELMLFKVPSILSTTPRRSPLEGAVPMPKISNCPNSLNPPTIAFVTVVPMSRTTILVSARDCLLCLIDYSAGMKIYFAWLITQATRM